MVDTVNVEKPTGVSVRAFSHGEESALLDVLSDAFGSFADVPRTKAVLSSRRFDADGCFIAEENGVPIGWVAATRLPRDNWFVIRYLSVRRARSKPQSLKDFSPKRLLMWSRRDQNS